MKRTIFLAAVATLAAGSALAQSSVTIYGRLNVTAEQQKNIGVNDDRSVLQDNASRLGFKGVEDLGGGLKADFLLEHRFGADTGTVTGDFWAGDAWVGLAGGFGWVRAGRLTSAAYYATADYISMHNHDTGTSADALYTYLSGAGKNTISYTTPAIGGFTLEGSVAAGEGNDAGKVYNLAANGKLGAFAIGLGYENQPELDNQQFAVRGLVELGALTLGAYYQYADLDADGDRNAYRGSAMYTMGSSEFHVNVGYADEFSKSKAGEALQYTLGYNYNLSKRTKVYGFYTKTDYDAGSVADPSSIAVGVRHNF